MKRNATLIAKYAITALCMLSSLFLLVGYATADNSSSTRASLAPSITWQIECVDCPKYFTEHDLSLQRDSSGNPHIVYGGDRVYHAWHDGSEWHNEVVDGTGST